MRFAFLALLIVAAEVQASDAPAPPASKPAAGCWANSFVADVCCSGAWGGSGCWEEKRSFNRCCSPGTAARSPAQPRGVEKEVLSGKCEKRLQHVAAALSTDRIVSHLVEPVESQVRQGVRELGNFTGPYTRVGLLSPYLGGLSPFERDMLLALVAIAAAALEAYTISYWLHGQSLIGALRNYGPEPWSEAVSFAAFAPSANDITMALLAGSRAARQTGNVHSSYGPVVVTPAAPAPGSQGHFHSWTISFAHGLPYHAGARAPSVEVIWLDVRGESAGWKHCYGDPLPMSHRELIALALPVVRGRPFANLRLPVPRHAWDMVRKSLPRRKDPHLQEATEMPPCTLGGHNGESERPLPCAGLSAMFPMVLLRHAFPSAKELLKQLGVVPQSGGASQSKGSLRALRRNAAAAAAAAQGRPALELSVEVAADPVRGASVLLFGEESGGGSRGGPFSCWLRIHGEHSLVIGSKGSG